VIKTGEAEDVRPIEVVLARIVLMPLLPLIPAAGEHIERLMRLVPACKVGLVVLRALDGPYV
jgi:hypothetical protein